MGGVVKGELPKGRPLVSDERKATASTEHEEVK
jgi:hypothetical protein